MRFAVVNPKFFWTAAQLSWIATAGPLLYTSMLYCTYRSRLPIEVQDPIGFFVQRVGGWFSVRPDGSVDYSLPEQWGYLIWAYDPLAERLPRLDWID